MTSCRVPWGLSSPAQVLRSEPASPPFVLYGTDAIEPTPPGKPGTAAGDSVWTRFGRSARMRYCRIARSDAPTVSDHDRIARRALPGAASDDLSTPSASRWSRRFPRTRRACRGRAADLGAGRARRVGEEAQAGRGAGGGPLGGRADGGQPDEHRRRLAGPGLGHRGAQLPADAGRQQASSPGSRTPTRSRSWKTPTATARPTR